MCMWIIMLYQKGTLANIVQKDIIDMNYVIMY